MMRVRAVAPLAGWQQGRVVDVDDTAHVRALVAAGLVREVGERAATSPVREPVAEPAADPDDEPLREDLERLTVAELRDLAGRWGVDLPASATKGEIVGILGAAL